MRKIFISSFHSLISRNLFQTGLIERLRKVGVRVYIFCPDYKEKYFRENFSYPEIEIIGVKEKKSSRAVALVRLLLSVATWTSTIKIHRREKYQRDGRFFNYFTSILILETLGRSRFFKAWLKKILFFSYRENIFEKYFKEQKPDLVFATDIFNWSDAQLIIESKKNNVPTVGMVRSWDNFTNKGALPASPDKMIVHNETIKQEAIGFENLPADKIFIIGIPQFDYYLNYQPTKKEEFCTKIGFDPSRKIILFSPQGKKFYQNDWFHIQVLHDAIASGQVEGQPQILVRCPPGDAMDEDKVRLSGSVNVFFNHPGVSFGSGRLKDKELDQQEMVHLADSLFWSNLVVNYGSTLSIDALAFDKPVILIAFTGLDGVDYLESIERFFKEYAHYKYLLKIPACQLVKNQIEYIDWVNKYLKEPSLHQAERRRLLRDQCYKFDGQSGRRLADFLLNELNN